MIGNVVKKIPVQLKQFISKQYYDSYSPIDHAVWRFVMKQNHYFLKGIAHPYYVNGLKDSGIKTESIPKVDDMNTSLAKVGWGAVTIDGLIPGSAFYGFLANGILPIATEIRKIENIAYTPAPDMIHEAAGHAPILLDESYRGFVKKIGEMGSKAISSKEKLEVFKAVRHLTIVAEDPHSTEEQVKEAERQVAEARTKVKGISEADQVSRLFWWTVEYGLIGELSDPKIYGAGLLSSVGESQSCLADDVQKIPFTVEECVRTPYDVTKPQPQLFVCKNFGELVSAIDQFAATMAFRKGGTEGLEKALQSDSVATICFSSGLQVTGTVATILKDDDGEAVYLWTKGPTALSFENKQLTGHGIETHRKGFGTPIGLLDAGIALEECSEDQVRDLGISEGKAALLHFESGVIVKGTVTGILSSGAKPILISFKDCTVTYEDQVLFEPDWGTFDMAVGAGIPSVFAGAADPDAYYQFKPAEEIEESAVQRSWNELETLYEEVRNIREGSNWNEQSLSQVDRILAVLEDKYQREWLLRLELLEIYQKHNPSHPTVTQLVEKLQNTDWDPSVQQMIQRGLTLFYYN
ncbi:aromatic amino acid hydroxylase [Neobacillus vireti]|uniref:Phenylalanine 4-monooxygenase n=1 Tax=Neobacillus vireti LMG 21834 TaxID=1131730 RepID=A0AB94IU88_9BACI|nr:aromatic amino acid hydroxylase [Neobacillus vireti]ETI70630.1 phenylalanine 4-monooxygenase [Neobacillus vireti LMG 21834]KLT15296.1 phenylalanine 4-monooxygenase [Neobacillus vireti]